MADLVLYSGETRFVRAKIWADSNPLSLQVKAAFVPVESSPTDDDWKDASWVPGQTWSDPLVPVQARVLIGPGGVFTLEPQTPTDLVFQVVSDPEVPWLRSGVLQAR